MTTFHYSVMLSNKVNETDLDILNLLLCLQETVIILCYQNGLIVECLHNFLRFKKKKNKIESSCV